MTGSDFYAPVIDQQQYEAIATQARGWTHAIYNRREKTFGSVVGVEICDRRFLASADHVLGEPAIEDLELITPLGGRPIKARVKGRDPALDLAFVELDSVLCGNIRFCPAGNLHPYAIKSKHSAVLVGFPFEAHMPVTRTVGGVCGTFYNVEPLPYAKWPKDYPMPSERRSGPSSRDDILFGLRLSDYDCEFSGPEGEKPRPLNRNQAPRPQGASGGGLWLLSANDMAIWRPDARLIGIQVGWSSRHEVGRAVRLRRWVDLLAAKYPEIGVWFSYLKPTRWGARPARGQSKDVSCDD